MLNSLLSTIRRYEMLQPGDTVTCAVSGGADSMALLWAMYLLREKLGIRLSAAHFNHGLRDAESDQDAEFVRSLCDRYDIPLHLGKTQVKARIFPNLDFLRTTLGRVPTAEEIHALIAEAVKKVNSTIPSYKHIRVLEILTEALEKTTTRKIKRYGNNMA